MMRVERTYKPISKVRFNLVGQRFGRLTVEKLLGSYKNNHYWLCRCDCGGSNEVSTGSLKNKNTESCGCLIAESISARTTTHGQSKTPLYQLWHRMLQRCEDKNCTDYKYYGARGITVCERWHAFENFKADVGDRPDGLTLDRKNNDSGYGPDNFRWASRELQANNMRSNVKTLVAGKLLSIKQMADKAGTSYDTMKARLTRLGYSAEEALTKPVKPGQTLEMAHAELIKID